MVATAHLGASTALCRPQFKTQVTWRATTCPPFLESDKKRNLKNSQNPKETPKKKNKPKQTFHATTHSVVHLPRHWPHKWPPNMAWDPLGTLSIPPLHPQHTTPPGRNEREGIRNLTSNAEPQTTVECGRGARPNVDATTTSRSSSHSIYTSRHTHMQGLKAHNLPPQI